MRRSPPKRRKPDGNVRLFARASVPAREKRAPLCYNGEITTERPGGRGMEDSMDIRTAAVVGAGALGTMYGQQIGKALGWDAVRIVTDPARAARYRKDGVLANGEPCPFRYFDGTEAAEPADLVLFAVKFSGLAEAMEEAAPLVGSHTVLLSVMNGVTSEDLLAERFGAAHVLLCTAQGMDATRHGNDTRFTHTGNLWIGPRQAGQEADAADAADFLGRAGIAYELADDMKLRLWRKLMMNVGINQATAVFETGYGGVKVPGEARDVMIAAMEETKTVANAMDIPLTEEDIAYWLDLTEQFDDRGMPSMRQDLLAGRKTELDLFAGTIRRLGAAHGVATPVNDLLYRLIRKMEGGE